jgi:hypothetical protein
MDNKKTDDRRVVADPTASGRRCNCDKPGDGLLCSTCRLPIGWEIPAHPVKLSKGLTCKQCADLLIPPQDVFHLRLLDISIPCPLCGTTLDQAETENDWELGFLDGCPQLASEASLLTYCHDVRERYKRIQPRDRSQRTELPPEYHLAGRMLLHWVAAHPQPSQAIKLELFAHWTAPIDLTLPELVALVQSPQSVDKNVLPSLYYGSVFLHQLQRRFKDGDVGERFRAQIMLRLLGPSLWTPGSKPDFTYPQRLILEDAYKALYWQGNADDETRSQRGLTYTLLETGPASKEARGCRKSQSRGCFIATACYGSHEAPEVIALRAFRDENLIRTRLGRALTGAYYCISPRIAIWLKQHPQIAGWVRNYILDRIVASTSRPTRKADHGRR